MDCSPAMESATHIVLRTKEPRSRCCSSSFISNSAARSPTASFTINPRWPRGPIASSKPPSIKLIIPSKTSSNCSKPRDFVEVFLFTNAAVRIYAESTSDPSSLDISSESGVAISFKAAGETNPSFAHVGEADVGIKVDFGTRGAFVLQAPETFHTEMGDRLTLQRRIIDAFKRGSWEKDWLVITRLVKATSATVLISKSSNAS